MRNRFFGAVCGSLIVATVASGAVLLATGDPGGGDRGRGPDETLLTQSEVLPSPEDDAFIDLSGLAPLETLPQQTVTIGADEPAPVVPPAAATPVAEQTAPAATGPVRGDTATVRAGSADERGRAALASLPFRWQELGVSVRFRSYRGGLLGLFEPRTNTVTVYVKPTQTEQGLRVTIAHELGHALDNKVNTVADRKAYLKARGLSTSTPWFPCLACSDYASGAGDFAEVFAVYVAGGGDFRSRLAAQPTYAQLVALAPFFQAPSSRPARATVPGTTPAPDRAPAPVTSTRPVAPQPRPTCTDVLGGLLGCK